MKNGIKESMAVFGCDREKFSVDTDEERCLKLGFRSGEIIRTVFKEVAHIAGAAPAPELSRFPGQDVLWYTKEDGCTYYFAPGNLREQGFKPYVPVDTKMKTVGRIRRLMDVHPITKEDIGKFFVMSLDEMSGRIVSQDEINDIDPDDIGGWDRIGELDVNRDKEAA